MSRKIARPRDRSENATFDLPHLSIGNSNALRTVPYAEVVRTKMLSRATSLAIGVAWPSRGPWLDRPDGTANRPCEEAPDGRPADIAAGRPRRSGQAASENVASGRRRSVRSGDGSRRQGIAAEQGTRAGRRGRPTDVGRTRYRS